MKLHAAILSNGDIDVSEVNLSQMDPEDIRVCVIHIVYALCKRCVSYYTVCVLS